MKSASRPMRCGCHIIGKHDRRQCLGASLPGSFTPGHSSRCGTELLESALDLLLRRSIDVQRERLAIVSYGALILADKSECVAPAFESRRIVGDQPDGLSIVGDCAFVL